MGMFSFVFNTWTWLNLVFLFVEMGVWWLPIYEAIYPALLPYCIRFCFSAHLSYGPRMEKSAFEHAQNVQIHPHAHALRHPGICSPFIHYSIVNDSVNGKRMPWSYCWSGPSLSAYLQRHVFSLRGTFDCTCACFVLSWLLKHCLCVFSFVYNTWTLFKLIRLGRGVCDDSPWEEPHTPVIPVTFTVFCFQINITKTYLYNFDPLKPQFYIVKLGFTGVYVIFLISAQKHRMWVLVRTASPRRF